jgi:hypothetical protein
MGTRDDAGSGDHPRPESEVPVQVTIQYFDGDPNWPTARDRVRDVLDGEGHAGVDIELQRIGSSAEAHEFRFRGSPTILLDGVDPFDSEESGYGLMCRVYRTEDGMDGAPSKLQLRDAMTRLAP